MTASFFVKLLSMSNSIQTDYWSFNKQF